MKAITLLLSIGLLAGTITAQIPRIVLQGSGSPQVYTSLDSAIADAQSNDVLYCSGGNFSISAALVINKPLHFIGAGIHPDSTQATGTTTFSMMGGDASLRLTEGASGSTFTGIYFVNSPINYTPLIEYGTSSDDDHVTNILFQRCRFSKGRINMAFSGASNIPAVPGLVTTFDECILTAYVDGRKRGAVFTRCIIDAHDIGVYAVTGFTGGSLTVQNCVFLNALMGNCANSIVRNSISTTTNYLCFDCTGASISNVLSAATNWFYGGTASITNSIKGLDPATFFVSETDNLYQFTDDLDMASGSPGINFGNDGNDIGIYGSSSPYKAGAIPFNPHYNEAIIAPATNSDGALPVNLRVAAQQQ